MCKISAGNHSIDKPNVFFTFFFIPSLPLIFRGIIWSHFKTIFCRKKKTYSPLQFWKTDFGRVTDAVGFFFFGCREPLISANIRDDQDDQVPLIRHGRRLSQDVSVFQSLKAESVQGAHALPQLSTIRLQELDQICFVACISQAQPGATDHIS